MTTNVLFIRGVSEKDRAKFERIARKEKMKYAGVLKMLLELYGEVNGED